MNNKKIKNEILISILVFIIGGITGYFYEEIFYLIQDGVLYNRGVLFGPFLPVYAFGALFMYLLLKKLNKHPILIFILAMLITGIVEYVTGYYLKYISKEILWDYTGLFLNIDGIVCLRSVVSFAIGGEILIYLIIPLLKRIIKKEKLVYIIIIIFNIFLISDLIYTGFFRG